MKKLALGSALLGLWPIFAFAQFPTLPNSGVPNDYSVTNLGTAAAKIIPAPAAPPGGGFVARRYAYVENPTTNTVSCSWTTSSPTVGGVGTFTLSFQYSWKSWVQPGFVPNSDLWCISSASSTTLIAQGF